MCGFVGFINKNNSYSYTNCISDLEKMGKAIQHRGPDYSGSYIKDNIFLWHNRLSIQDLSKNGNQPMLTEDGKEIILFNGEIYNHFELRKIINSKYQYNWKSSSDTETLLIFIHYFGMELALSKISGMFSIVYLNLLENKIYLARDRFGEKPLYFSISDQMILFSSEMKALKYNTMLNKNISTEALRNYFYYGYIPSPLSVYDGIFKVEPSTLKIISIDDHKIQSISYWNLVKNYRSKFNKSISDEEIKSHSKKLLTQSVKEQLISDVPLGCFLSGGIDSTLITAIAQENNIKKINTFSIGFDSKFYDESKYSDNIANILGTQHYSIKLTNKEIAEAATELGNIYCEPFADSSQIPTLLLSRFAKKHVTVCLSGDGGDEMFLGYNRYLYSEFYFNKLKILPLRLRILISFFLLSFNYDNYNKIYSILNNLKITKTRYEVGELIHKFAKVLKINSYENLYKNFVGTIDDKNILRNSIISKNFANENLKISSTEDMNIEDFKNYLPEDILCKVDRASMSTSLETRMPFLNKDLYEYLSNIPVSKKILSNKLKSISKSLVYDYVPSKYFNTQKKGFSIPLDKLLRNELKSFCLDTIHTGNSNLNEFLNMKNLHNIFQFHQDNKKNFGKEIWNSVMFIKWFNSQ